MKNRISLDDPDYNQKQQVVIQDNKAKIVWFILGIIAAIIIVFAVFSTKNSKNSGSQNPHDNCTYIGKDREYFAGPMVDVYYNYDHPEWGYHVH